MDRDHKRDLGCRVRQVGEDAEDVEGVLWGKGEEWEEVYDA